MTKPNDPAIAHVAMEMRESALQSGKEPKEIHYFGLTKREWFAGMVAQGTITIRLPEEDKHLLNPEFIAQASVLMADALIKELSK